MEKFIKKMLDYGERISSIPFTSRVHIQNPYKIRDEKDVFFNSDPYLTGIIVRITYLDYMIMKKKMMKKKREKKKES
jgi:hypothetical protein